MKRLEFKTTIKLQKLQYDINGEAAKISALSSGKIDKYEYLTGKEILTSDQIQWKKLKLYTPLLEKCLKNKWKKKRIKSHQNNKIANLYKIFDL